MDEGYQTFDASKLSDTLPSKKTEDSHHPSEEAEISENHSVFEASIVKDDDRTIENTEKMQDNTYETVVPSTISSKNESSEADSHYNDHISEEKQPSADVPGIKVINSTDRSSSSSSDDSGDEKKKKKPWRNKRVELLAELKEASSRLTEETAISEHLRIQLQEETDAKERLQSQLSKLQSKHQDQLKDEESLRCQLNNKDEYCHNLERKQSNLDQELTGLKIKLAEFEQAQKTEPNLALDNETESMNDDEPVTRRLGSPVELENLNQKLNEELSEFRYKLKSGEVLIKTYLAQIEKLDSENITLKDNLSVYESGDQNELTENERQKILPLVEEKVQARLQDMEQCLVDQSQQQSRIKVLESETVTLQETLAEHQKKYAEALVTLKEVQDAYGEMRDIVLEKYKQELAMLQDKLRIAEENNNESIITGLRQKVLDARLLHERAKQTHRDELEQQKKIVEEAEEKLINTLKELEDSKRETEKMKSVVDKTQASLTSVRELEKERMQKIMELRTEIVSLNDTVKLMKKSISEKDKQISDQRNQLIKEVEMLTKEHAEKKALQKELEEMQSVKRHNERLEEEIEELKHQIKLRGMKIRFLKKQMKELEEQKEKAESIMFVLPEMQKKIDQLDEEKQKLQHDLEEHDRQEQERIQKMEQKKRDEEERIRKEKEDWERKVLGIGNCEFYHEGDMIQPDFSESFERPNSAPLMKPRPPSARRFNASNGQRKLFTSRAQSLNPTYLNSYPAGRKASEKMKQHQEKIMFMAKNKNKLFQPVSHPMDLVNSYSHTSGEKHFPKITRKSSTALNGNLPPRVLVWGNSEEGPGKKLVAVGDRVVANVLHDCAQHGRSSHEHTGFVKFIGFIDDNNVDVYIGLRLDDEVGSTDGCANGKRYFRCEPKKGKFVRLDDIVKILESQTKHAPTFTI